MPFQKGQSGNPGGKVSQARQELADLLDTTWSIASRRKVLKRLIADAEGGVHEARVLLLAYSYGKPVERKELSGANGESLIVQVLYADPDPDASEAP